MENGKFSNTPVAGRMPLIIARLTIETNENINFHFKLMKLFARSPKNIHWTVFHLLWGKSSFKGELAREEARRKMREILRVNVAEGELWEKGLIFSDLSRVFGIVMVSLHHIHVST